MIKVIVFDMDDTLFLERDFVLSGFLAVDHFLELKGISGFYNKSKELFENDIRGNIFNEVFEYFSIPYSNNDIKGLVDIYRNHLPNIKLLEESSWVISELTSGYQLGLITDGYLNVQQNKVKALGLADYFQYIIFTDQFGRKYWKPSERSYIEMKKFFNVKHHELVYIGDNPKKDFISAKKLGWKTVHIDRGNSEYSNVKVSEDYQADYSVNSLYEIPTLIEKL